MESTPNGCIYKTVLQPRLRDYWGKGGRKDVRAKGSGSCCGIVSPGGTRICTRELSSVSAQTLAGQAWWQRTWHIGWGRAHKASALHEEPQATEWSCERKRRLSPGQCTPTGCPVTKGPPWKKHIHTCYIWTEQVILRNMYAQTSRWDNN